MKSLKKCLVLIVLIFLYVPQEQVRGATTFGIDLDGDGTKGTFFISDCKGILKLKRVINYTIKLQDAGLKNKELNINWKSAGYKLNGVGGKDYQIDQETYKSCIDKEGGVVIKEADRVLFSADQGVAALVPGSVAGRILEFLKDGPLELITILKDLVEFKSTIKQTKKNGENLISYNHTFFTHIESNAIFFATPVKLSPFLPAGWTGRTGVQEPSLSLDVPITEALPEERNGHLYISFEDLKIAFVIPISVFSPQW